MSKKLNCILLVDDDTEDNHYHKIVLDDMHITTQVEIARDGIEALQYLTKENQITPELIFLDINMPRMNGWEFLEAYEKLTDAQKEGKIIDAYHFYQSG
jgi:CheY-like chemotaxis protein